MWNKNEILQHIRNEIYHCSRHSANLFLLQNPFVFQRIKTNVAINKKINKYEKKMKYCNALEMKFIIAHTAPDNDH